MILDFHSAVAEHAVMENHLIDWDNIDRTPYGSEKEKPFEFAANLTRTSPVNLRHRVRLDQRSYAIEKHIHDRMLELSV